MCVHYTRGIQKVLRQILKKKSLEYGNQIESCKYSHLIWLPYSEFFLEFVLELFECPSYIRYVCTHIHIHVYVTLHL